MLENLPDGGPEADRLYVNAATIPLGEVTQRAQVVQEGAEILPVSADDQKPPGKACGVCAVPSTLSVRGLCRSCEGKAARALARVKPKEITA